MGAWGGWYITSTHRKQREMDVGASLVSAFYVVQGPSLGMEPYIFRVCLPTSVNPI